MFGFLKTINIIYGKKVIFTQSILETINILKNATKNTQLSNSINLTCLLIDNARCYNHGVTMPRRKKVKLGAPKLCKEISVKRKRANKSKRYKKRPKLMNAENMSNRSRTSEFISESTKTSSNSDGIDSDVCVVFDSKEDRVRKAEEAIITIHSDDSNEAIDSSLKTMGNASSDSVNPAICDNFQVNQMSYNVPSQINQMSYNAPSQINQMSYNFPSHLSQMAYNVPSPLSCDSYNGQFQTSYTTDSCSTYEHSFNNEEPVAVVNSDNGREELSSRHKDDSEAVGLKEKRHWQKTSFGSTIEGTPKSTSHHLLFTILSYNVLSQDLAESHMYLYKGHDEKYLAWEHRSNLLFKEIKEANADILCLQEVQESHLDIFYDRLSELGYDGIYKKRTGRNVDGVAIYYKVDVFRLSDYTSVEYFQPGVEVLDRDNVGLVAKFSIKANPSKHVVIATTHLLFNPKRHDVKLAQTQMLLTEVERFAFDSFRHGNPVYWPVMITGDMNFEPYSGVYQLLTQGMFRFEGCNRRLTHVHPGPLLSKELLPRNLNILDTCQHWGVLCRRLIDERDHKAELKLLKVYNTDHQAIMRNMSMVSEVPKSFEQLVDNIVKSGLVNNFMPSFGPSSIPPLPEGGHGTGQLNHNLNLHSVYSHNTNGPYSESEVTTFHDKWLTVDYIFYSRVKNKSRSKKITQGNLHLVSKLKLLNVSEAYSFGRIPNKFSPSDHYPLLATFYYKF